ncbi:hypothetical protein [Nocardia sp. CNY236]|uniref:hypothetical protein n=1 Tax=Nocardia sp. CNY236 TaxID=1169152 RepID=UPI000403AB6D|nr:hypothetical protein [Nocardia sp. CNY236]
MSRYPDPDLSGLPDRYLPAWEAFADWCIARELCYMPAQPDVIVAYLKANHRQPATQRARVAAINAAHRHYGHPKPGRAEAVRELCNPTRAARRARTQTAVDTVLAELPTHGWTRGLFGRRDAALLTLAAAGLSFPRLVALRQHQIQITATAVVVDGGMLIMPSRPRQPLLCPVQILRRWAAVTNLAPRGIGPAILAERLTDNTLPATDFDPRWAHQPLLTAITATGYPAGDTPIGRLRPLHPGSATEIAAAHLAGTPPRHRTLLPAQQRATPDADPTPMTARLDPHYHDHGIAARHRDRPIHDQIDDLLDDLEAKIRAATTTSAALLAHCNDPDVE